jgi:hypothetical protein
MDCTDFENMISMETSVKTSVVPRWERRLARAEAEKASASVGDRYIPNRSGMDFDSFQSSSSSSSSNGSADIENSNTDSEFNKLVASNLGEDLASSRVLAYKQKAPTPADGMSASSLRVLYSASQGKKEIAAKPMRHIPSAPLRVLDAPDLMDDYCKPHYPFIIVTCF